MFFLQRYRILLCTMHETLTQESILLLLQTTARRPPPPHRGLNSSSCLVNGGRPNARLTSVKALLIANTQFGREKQTQAMITKLETKSGQDTPCILDLRISDPRKTRQHQRKRLAHKSMACLNEPWDIGSESSTIGKDRNQPHPVHFHSQS